MFTIISVGKLKPHWRELADEYITRTAPYLPIRIIEIPETPFSKNDDREKIIGDEARRLIKVLKPSAHIIAMHPSAHAPTTKQFCELAEKWRRKQEIIFVIGGPLGLDETILARADEKISLSPLTFTHQMTRVILLEQIYRSIMAEKGKYDY